MNEPTVREQPKVEFIYQEAPPPVVYRQPAVKDSGINPFVIGGGLVALGLIVTALGSTEGQPNPVVTPEVYHPAVTVPSLANPSGLNVEIGAAVAHSDELVINTPIFAQARQEAGDLVIVTFQPSLPQETQQAIQQRAQEQGYTQADFMRIVGSPFSDNFYDPDNANQINPEVKAAIARFRQDPQATKVAQFYKDSILRFEREYHNLDLATRMALLAYEINPTPQNQTEVIGLLTTAIQEWQQVQAQAKPQTRAQALTEPQSLAQPAPELQPQPEPVKAPEMVSGKTTEAVTLTEANYLGGPSVVLAEPGQGVFGYSPDLVPSYLEDQYRIFWRLSQYGPTIWKVAGVKPLNQAETLPGILKGIPFLDLMQYTVFERVDCQNDTPTLVDKLTHLAPHFVPCQTWGVNFLGALEEGQMIKVGDGINIGHIEIINP